MKGPFGQAGFSGDCHGLLLGLSGFFHGLSGEVMISGEVQVVLAGLQGFWSAFRVFCVSFFLSPA